MALLDAYLIRRAVWNMLENSVKYTPAAGSISLSASTEQRGGESFLVISVSDTGIGISQNEQERIFDKYYRSPKAAGIKGTGLGLAIVKAVADAHSGKIEVESEPWKGSTFRLLLPIQS
jgi:two-component system aerobic respiration control sensor histidine kinase ArcB